tara:strand:+ start:1901 stop:2758 length:858 start_codon:yes stop_codon:yes gene_type:complete
MCLFLSVGAQGQVQDDRHAAYARAHISWSLYHETGHAIQDFTGDRLVMSKAEREVHADKIAAYLLLPTSEDQKAYQLYYDAAMELYYDPDAPDPDHIYEASRVRAERMLCMLYGASPNSQWIADARQFKNRSDADCIADFKAFQKETVDVLGFAREVAELEEPSFILPKYNEPVAPNHADAYDYLKETEILDDIAIDVEEWLPALQVSEKPFQIVAQECAGFSGFRYVWDHSAVVACYAEVQRCMNRPGYLPPELGSAREETRPTGDIAGADQDDWIDDDVEEEE